MSLGEWLLKPQTESAADRGEELEPLRHTGRWSVGHQTAAVKTEVGLIDGGAGTL